MPKLPECDRCFLYAHNPHLICAVHPTGPNTDTCPDFLENPDAEPDELWEPEGASYYNGELILQPRQQWMRWIGISWIFLGNRHGAIDLIRIRCHSFNKLKTGHAIS